MDNLAFVWSPFTDGAHKETITQLSPNQIEHIKMKGVRSIQCKVFCDKVKVFLSGFAVGPEICFKI